MKLAVLAPLYERPAWWATVYAVTSSTDESTAGRRALQARQVGADLADSGADEATCEAVGQTLESYPHAAGGPAGHAMFASGGSVVLDLPLAEAPTAVPAATWSRLPHVAPLLEFVPEEPDCLVVRVDRAGADLELRRAVGRGPAGTVRSRPWRPHRTARADWSEHRFRASAENTWAENAKAVAAEIQERVAETGAAVVVLAGDERERRSVREHLPRQPGVTVTESVHGGRGPGADPRLLDADVEAARLECLRRRTDEEISRFEHVAATGRGAGPGAAEGVPAVVEAAREHRVDRLFLAPHSAEAHREVWAGTEPAQIALRRGESRYLGAGEPFAARADDALLRAVATTGAEGVCVTPHPGGHPAGGLGALLRWTY